MNKTQGLVPLLCMLACTLSIREGRGDSSDQIRAQWQQQSNSTRGDWTKIRDREADEWKAREKRIRLKWSDGLVSSAKAYVGYVDDDSSRVRINYETGKIEIETIFALGKKPSADELRRRMQSLLKDVLAPSQGEPAALVAEDIEGSVELSSLSGQAVEGDAVTGDDGIKRSLYKVSLKMVPDHISRRASRVLPVAKEWAGKTGVDPSLILGVIRQESAFNPRARSHIPAFGLMQIVPEYAGQEVMSEVSGSKTIPDSEFLYVPENNIMVGTKYLAMLRDKYFPEIKDEVKRSYLMICSYNWGPGRIRTAIDKKRINPTARADELFQRLRAIAPSETSEYLKKVTEYRAGFREL